MNILLINTSNMQYRGIFRERNSLPPLGLLYLAAIAKERLGCECKVIDFVVQDIGRQELRDLLREYRPGVVGFCTYADSCDQLVEVAEFVKAELPETTTVIGGVFATFCHEDLLRRHACLDLAVLGEGEITFVELLEALNAGGGPDAISKVAGLAMRSGAQIVCTSPRARIRDLDSLPFPDRSLIQPLIDDMQYSLPFTISTSRGCPGDCIFCSSRAFWGSAVRRRSAANIFAEVLHLHKTQDMYSFHICDDTFTSRPSTVEEFCKLLTEAEIPVKWSCESRADIVTRELLETLFNSGCKSIQFGIESGYDHILSAIGKKVRTEQIETAVKMASEIGFKVIGSFILGHYLDTRETMLGTIDFCRKLKDRYGLSPAYALNTPFPGTYQREHASDLGMTVHTQEYSDLILCKPHISTPHFSQQDLQEMFFIAADTLS